MALEGYTSSTIQGGTSTRKNADGTDYTTVLGAKQGFLEAGTQSSLTVEGKFSFDQADNGKTPQITFNHGATFTANAAEQNGQTSLYVYGAPAGQVVDVDGTLWQDENGRNAGVRGTLKVTDAYVLRGDNTLGAGKGKATLSAAGSDLEIGSLVMDNGANVSLGGQSANMLNDDGTEVVVQAQNGNKSIKTAKVQDSHSVLKVNDIVEMRNAPETAVQAQTVGLNDGSELYVQGLSLNGWTQVSVFGLADGEDYIGVDGRRLMNETGTEYAGKRAVLDTNGGEVRLAGGAVMVNDQVTERRSTLTLAAADAKTGALSLIGVASLTLSGRSINRLNEDGTEFKNPLGSVENLYLKGAGSTLEIDGWLTVKNVEPTERTKAAAVAVRNGSHLTADGIEVAGAATFEVSSVAAGRMLDDDRMLAVSQNGAEFVSDRSSLTTGDVSFAGMSAMEGDVLKYYRPNFTFTMSDVTVNSLSLRDGAYGSLNGATSKQLTENGSQYVNESGKLVDAYVEGSGAKLNIAGRLALTNETEGLMSNASQVSVFRDSAIDVNDVVMRGSTSITLNGLAAGSAIGTNGLLLVDDDGVPRELRAVLDVNEDLNLQGAMEMVANKGYTIDGEVADVPTRRAANLSSSYGDITARNLLLGEGAGAAVQANSSLTIRDTIALAGGIGMQYADGTMQGATDLTGRWVRANASLSLANGSDATTQKLLLGKYSSVNVTAQSVGGITQYGSQSSLTANEVVLENNEAGLMDQTTGITVNGASSFKTDGLTLKGRSSLYAYGVKAGAANDEQGNLTTEDLLAVIKAGDVTLQGLSEYYVSSNDSYMMDGQRAEIPTLRTASMTFSQANVDFESLTAKGSTSFSFASSVAQLGDVMLEGDTGKAYLDGTMNGSTDVSGRLVRENSVVSVTDSTITAESMTLGKHAWLTATGSTTRRTEADGTTIDYVLADTASDIRVSGRFEMANETTDEQENRRNLTLQRGSTFTAAEGVFRGNVGLSVTGVAPELALSAEGEIMSEALLSKATFGNLTLEGVPDGEDGWYGARMAANYGEINVNGTLKLEDGALVQVYEGGVLTVGTLDVSSNDVSITYASDGRIKADTLFIHGSAEETVDLSIDRIEASNLHLENGSLHVNENMDMTSVTAEGASALHGLGIVTASSLTFDESDYDGNLIMLDEGAGVHVRNSEINALTYRSDATYDFANNTETYIGTLILTDNGFKTTMLEDWASQGVFVDTYGVLLGNIAVGADDESVSLSTSEGEGLGGFADKLSSRPGDISISSEAVGRHVELLTNNAIAIPNVGAVTVDGTDNRVTIAGTGQLTVSSIEVMGAGNTVEIFADAASRVTHQWVSDEGSSRVAVIGTKDDVITIDDLTGIYAEHAVDTSAALEVQAAHVESEQVNAVRLVSKDNNLKIGDVYLDVRDTLVHGQVNGLTLEDDPDAVTSKQLSIEVGDISLAVSGASVENDRIRGVYDRIYSVAGSKIESRSGKTTVKASDSSIQALVGISEMVLKHADVEQTGLELNVERGDLVMEGSDLKISDGVWGLNPFSNLEGDRITAKYGSVDIDLKRTEIQNAVHTAFVGLSTEATAGTLSTKLEDVAIHGELFGLELQNGGNAKVDAISMMLKDSTVDGNVYGVHHRTSYSNSTASSVRDGLSVTTSGAVAIGGNLYATYDYSTGGVIGEDLQLTLPEAVLQVGGADETSTLTVNGVIDGWTNVTVASGSSLLAGSLTAKTLNLWGELAVKDLADIGTASLNEGSQWVLASGSADVEALALHEGSSLTVGAQASLNAASVTGAEGSRITLMGADVLTVGNASELTGAELFIKGGAWTDQQKTLLAGNAVSLGGADALEGGVSLALDAYSNDLNVDVLEHATVTVNGALDLGESGTLHLEGGALNVSLSEFFDDVTLLETTSSDRVIGDVGEVKSGINLHGGTLVLTGSEALLTGGLNSIREAVSDEVTLTVMNKIQDLTVDFANQIEGEVTVGSSELKNDLNKTALIVSSRADAGDESTSVLTHSMGFESLSGVADGVEIETGMSLTLVGNTGETVLSDGEITNGGTLTFGSAGIDRTQGTVAKVTTTGTLEVVNGSFAVDDLKVEAAAGNAGKGGKVEIREGSALKVESLSVDASSEVRLKDHSELVLETLEGVAGTISGESTTKLTVTDAAILENGAELELGEADFKGNLTLKGNLASAGQTTGADLTVASEGEYTAASGVAAWANVMSEGTVQVQEAGNLTAKVLTVNGGTLRNAGKIQTDVLTLRKGATFGEVSTFARDADALEGELEVYDAAEVEEGATLAQDAAVFHDGLSSEGELRFRKLTTAGAANFRNGSSAVDEEAHFQDLTLSGAHRLTGKNVDGASLVVEADAHYEASGQSDWGNINVAGHFAAQDLIVQNTMRSEGESRVNGALTLGASGQLKPAGGTFAVNTLKSTGGTIDLSDKGTLEVERLENDFVEYTNVLVNAASTAGQLVVGDNNNARLKVTGTAEMNEGRLTDLQAMADIVDIRDGTDDYRLFLPENTMMGELTARVEDGVVQSVTVTEKKHSVNNAISNATAASLALWRDQIIDVGQRLGDLRLYEDQAGGWVRMTGGKTKFGDDKSIENQFTTIEVGSDVRLTPNVYAGVMGSYTTGESTASSGTTDMGLAGWGLYAGWMADSGFYFDGAFKQMKLDNDFDLHNDAGKTRADTDVWAYSAALEAGWHWNLSDTGLWVEPKMGVAWGHVCSTGFTTSLDVQAKQSGLDTLVGRLGVSAGIRNERGSVYGKLTALYDFEGKSTLALRHGDVGYVLEQDLGNAWFEAGVGGAYRITDALSLYGELDAAYGSALRSPFKWNFGLRYGF